MVVDGNGALWRQGDAKDLEVETCSAGTTACGHEDDISINIGDVLHCCLHLEGDTLLLQILTQALGNIGIEGRQTFFEELDDRHLRAKTMEHRGKLHADDACANDGKALGQRLQLKQARRVDDSRIVAALDGEPLGLGACGDDDVGGGELTTSCNRVATDGTGVEEGGMAADQRDVGMRKDSLNALTELGHHLRHALAGLAECP